MGKIYNLESELRELCKDYDNNIKEIYDKLLELVKRLLARNTRMIGPDVDRSSLAYEIVEEIITKISCKKIAPLTYWSGYITQILPRMIKRNAKDNSPEVIDTISEGIDEHCILDMIHSGTISLINSERSKQIINLLEELPCTIEGWLDENLVAIDRCSKLYSDMRVSIILSLLYGKIVLYRLPESYKSLLIYYVNKIKISIARDISRDQPIDTYDLVSFISNSDSLENLDDD